MTSLYSCRHDGDQYRITKMDHDLNVESSYLCTFDECECPAGVRPMCRHREMLPKFIQREAVGTGWFFDYDRGGWVQMWEDEPEPHSETVNASDFDSEGAGSTPAVAAIAPSKSKRKPDGRRL